MESGFYSSDSIKGTGYGFIAFTSLIVIARFAVSIRRFQDLKADDILLFLAYVFFIVMCAVYIWAADSILQLDTFLRGTISMYPAFIQDNLRTRIAMFITSPLLLLIVWMIKFSYFAIFKRFMLLILCLLFNWCACSSLRAWFDVEKCNTEHERMIGIEALYFQYVADLVTDFMVMAIPIRLLWNIKMRRAQKLSTGGLFCLSLFIIVISTIRVVKLHDNTAFGRPRHPHIAMWGIIEAAMAVIIGSCPGLYVFFNARASRSSGSYRCELDPMCCSQRPLGNTVPSFRSDVETGRILPSAKTDGKLGGDENKGSPPCGRSLEKCDEEAGTVKRPHSIVVTSDVDITVADGERFQMVRR